MPDLKPDKITAQKLKRCHAKLLECRQDHRRPYLNPDGDVLHFKSRNQVDLELQRLEIQISQLQESEVTEDA